MTSEYTCDLLIVGGGPAGCAAAFTAAKEGHSIIIVDRKDYEHIGDKVCGDALAPPISDELYDLVGLPKPDPAKQELMEVCSNVVLQGIQPHNKILLGSQSATVDRLRYGQALLHAVEAFDTVTIMPDTKYMEAITEDGYLVGAKCMRQGEVITINATITLDASGSSGVVRSRLPVAFHTKFPKKIPKYEMIVAYREIIRTSTPHPYQDSIYLTYEPEIKDAMPGYYWYFSRGEKELNIGLGYLMIDSTKNINIREINEQVRRRRFPDAEVLASQGDQIPSRLPLPSLVHNGFMAAGDAGALANPLNGEGHGPALTSGIYAAKFAHDALITGDVSEQALWPYNRWIWHHFGVEFSYGIAIVKFIIKYGIESLDFLLEKQVLQQDDLLNIVNDPDAKLNVVKRAVRGWKQPRLLLGLRKVLSLSDTLRAHAKAYPEPDQFDAWNRKLDQLVAKNV